eukprot:scaffold3649_cov30-Tisochrysis_lutea.AAC.4
MNSSIKECAASDVDRVMAVGRLRGSGRPSEPISSSNLTSDEASSRAPSSILRCRSLRASRLSVFRFVVSSSLVPSAASIRACASAYESAPREQSEPIHVRVERTQVLGEQLGDHVSPSVDQVEGLSATCGLEVEWRIPFDEVAYVCNVYAHLKTAIA